MDWKIGRSVGTQTLDAPFFQDLKANGIESVELSMKQDQYDTFDYAAIRRFAEEAGVRINSFHLPFYPGYWLDPSTPDEAKRAETITTLKRMLDHAATAGARFAVIHPSGEPYADEERPGRIAQAKATLAELCDYAESKGVHLAVENLPRTCLGRDSGEMLELISADDRLVICFDTNHLLSEDPVDFIKACGHKIVTLHVSDYDRLDERHWLPGEGTTDWPALVNALWEAGYNGPWNYEVPADPNPNQTPAYTRTNAMYRQNAEEILGGKPITVRAKPVEGLLDWKEAARRRAEKKRLAALKAAQQG